VSCASVSPMTMADNVGFSSATSSATPGGKLELAGQVGLHGLFRRTTGHSDQFNMGGLK
jgi:hypothetical protein